MTGQKLEDAQLETEFENFVRAGRLMFRVQEDMWIAYFGVDGDEEIVRLGAISVNAIGQSDERKQAFMTLMKEVTSDLLEEVLGERIVWPHDPEIVNVKD